MRRALLIVGTLMIAVGVVLAVLYLARGNLAETAMGRIYDQAMASDPLAELPDGLHVGLCGSGSPMPDPTRAGPCVAVVAGQKLFVVDSGQGSTRNLSIMNLPPPRVDAIFLTHFHSDHIADLGELLLQRWAGGARTEPVPVYGPTGVVSVVEGLEAAYELDRGYRIAHHGEATTPPSGFGGDPRAFAVDRNQPDVLVIAEPDLKVWAFPVQHNPAEPSVGYLFEYKDRRVVISGDTGPSLRLAAAARDADLLLHEGLSPKLVARQREAALKGGRANYAKILADIPSYHTAPEDAATIARRAGVKMLMFYHEIPPLPVRALEGPFLGNARSIYKGPIHVGRDGDFVSMPAGSDEIVLGNRMETFGF